MLNGAGCLPRAVALLRRSPHLWRYVGVPILVNLVVGVVLYAVLLVVGLRAIDRATAGAGGGAALGAVIQVVFAVLVLLAVGFVLVRFGVVLGSPWYTRLSERVEEQLTGAAAPAEPLTFAGVAADLGRALRFEAGKLALLVVVGLPLLVVNVLPGVGQLVAAGGGLALGATIACLDFFDGPLGRRQRPFRARLGYIRRTLPASAGFGVACAALLGVPLLNLLSLPVCVTAGTIFYCDHRDANAEPPPS